MEDNFYMSKEMDESRKENERQKRKLTQTEAKMTSQKKMQSSLHQRIVDCEKRIGDNTIEQTRLRTKNETKLTQAIELEALLTSRGQMSEELKTKFDLIR